MTLTEKDISKLANDHPDDAPAEWHELVGVLWKFVGGKLLAPDRLRYAAGLADRLAHGGLTEAQSVAALQPHTALVSPNAALILTRAAHVLEDAADAIGPQPRKATAGQKKGGRNSGRLPLGSKARVLQAMKAFYRKQRVHRNQTEAARDTLQHLKAMNGEEYQQAATYSTKRIIQLCELR